MPAKDKRKPQDPGIMNVLFEARRMRNSSSNSGLHSPRDSEVKHARSKEQMVVEPPKHAKRVTFSKPRLQQQTTVKDGEVQTGLTSCLITNPSIDPRVTGGANNPAERKVGWLARTDSECQFKAPGIDFLTERDTNVITFEVKMRDSLQSVKDYTTKCDYFPKYVDKRPFKDQATQTLYRESSAQTLAYLPDITDKEQDENLEIFNLSTLLPGDKPPGIYEVEVLERARKRWAFNKALKISFKKQLHEARESAIKSKYRPILEAFEWENWIEREEYIQECQMMRLEIVIRMFDKREKDMHTASKSRIETACETIELRRQRGLTKNEIEYQRAVRRLQIKQSGLSRRWKKQSPMQALGSPCSEFYGPLIRHGVDPARRNFVGDGRKAFDMRIDDLEKRVNMKQLSCPFTKLKEWSKPKEYVKEYEQNFCSDKNLQKLYESLKSLRSQATKQKVAPKCLKRRPKPKSEVDSRISFNYEGGDARDFFKDRLYKSDETKLKDALLPEQLLAITQFLEDEKRREERPNIAQQMLRERRHEDLEQLLNMYEGTTIGWIMQFLSEEMERLQEQRKLHFFSILAQKERWRREAAEAGLRQKENDLRVLYEDIFQESNVVYTEVTDDYINTILTTDMAHIAENEAADSITKLAKQIDADIQRWLESFKLTQTPLTYEPLRELLRSMVFPDFNKLVLKHEKSLLVKYIIDDVIFPRMWDELETYDIASTLTSDLIDRLIDNDLYLFSTDSESEEPQRKAWYEVEAILRKLIRQAVPGRRWKTETERVVHENCISLFDDIFNQITMKMDMDLPPMDPVELHGAISHQNIAKTDNIRQKDQETVEERSKPEDPLADVDDTTLLRTQVLSLLKKMKTDKITKPLVTDEIYLGDDKLKDGTYDNFINKEVLNAFSVEKSKSVETVCSIISTLDIGKEEDFSALRHKQQQDEQIPGMESSSLSDIGVKFDNDTQTEQEDQLIGMLADIINASPEEEEIPEAYSEYEADDERSLFNLASEEGEFDQDEYDEEQVEEEIMNKEEDKSVEEKSVDGKLVKRKLVEEKSVELNTEAEVAESSPEPEDEEPQPKLTITLLDDTDEKTIVNAESGTYYGELGTSGKSIIQSNYDVTVVLTEEEHELKARSTSKIEDSHRE